MISDAPPPWPHETIVEAVMRGLEQAQKYVQYRVLGRQRAAAQCGCGAILDKTWHGYVHSREGRRKHREFGQRGVHIRVMLTGNASQLSGVLTRAATQVTEIEPDVRHQTFGEPRTLCGLHVTRGGITQASGPVTCKLCLATGQAVARGEWCLAQEITRRWDSGDHRILASEFSPPARSISERCLRVRIVRALSQVETTAEGPWPAGFESERIAGAVLRELGYKV